MRRAGLFGVPRVRPWSWQAFLLGFVVVAMSAALQGGCVALGAKLYFAAFIPSIFLVGILAGAPAAAFAVLLTIPLVWWAFMPPFFEFSPLTTADSSRTGTHTLSPLTPRASRSPASGCASA